MYRRFLYVEVPDSAAMKSLTLLVSSGSPETICNNLNMRKKNHFVNEQFCSREAVRFFWDPVASC